VRTSQPKSDCVVAEAGIIAVAKTDSMSQGRVGIESRRESREERLASSEIAVEGLYDVG
jgi:metal-dependent HD superfamily phosphatase/phosphodiesterase